VFPQRSAGRSEENDIESSKDAAIGHEQCFSSEGRQRDRRLAGIGIWQRLLLFRAISLERAKTLDITALGAGNWTC
jgi:hypothetical protein